MAAARPMIVVATATRPNTIHASVDMVLAAMMSGMTIATISTNIAPQYFARLMRPEKLKRSVPQSMSIAPAVRCASLATKPCTLKTAGNRLYPILSGSNS